MKSCQNCKIYRGCFYRGIINPCDEWQPNRTITSLRKKAAEVVNKPMTSREHEFVFSCTTATYFTPKQEGWLQGILARMG